MGALLFAAPLAAINLTPGTTTQSKTGVRAAAKQPSSITFVETREVPADLPHIIAQGVSTSVSTAVAAVAPAATKTSSDVKVASADGATLESRDGTTVARSSDGATVTTYAPDAQGRRKMVVRSANGTVAIAFADANDDHARRARNRAIDAAIAAKAIGVTPEYIAAMRAAAPRLANLDFDEFSGLRAMGVTPEYARGLAAAGFPSISADELMQARAVGLTGDYVRAMRAAGIGGDLDEFIQLRSVGVDPSFAARVKSSGLRVSSADELLRLHALDLAHPPTPPRPPAPPNMHSRTGRPAASPPNWNSPDDDGG